MRRVTTWRIEKMACQAIVPKVYCLESVVHGHHIYGEYGLLWWEKITYRYQIRRCQRSKGSCSSKVWRCCHCLVYLLNYIADSPAWLGVGSLFTDFKYRQRLMSHDGSLMFATLTLPTCLYQDLYLVRLLQFCLPLFCLLQFRLLMFHILNFLVL